MITKKILITGAHGMLGYDFVRFTQEHGGYELIPLGRIECDITSMASVGQALSVHHPDIVLNCAAYTSVDDAEDIGRQANYEVNALGVWNLARVCQEMRIDLITISTDYVFDGTQGYPYAPSDIPHPINAYGMAKYLGEHLAMESYPDVIIVRTSWLYGGTVGHKNFVNTMLRIASERSETSVVDDQFGAPTHTHSLIQYILAIIENISAYRGKILHICDATDSDRGVSWCEFAQEIFAQKKIDISVKPIHSDGYPVKARRPHHGKLAISDVGGYDPIGWRESLNGYLENLYTM